MMVEIHSEAGEAAITRLLWREQIAALPLALRAAARRLLRREPRWYYVVDGHVVARFTSAEDRTVMLDWMAQMHTETFHHGVNFATGVTIAINGDQADPGNPGPS